MRNDPNKSIDRKVELLDAAEKLFLSNGYETTSVNEIVNSVNVSKGTFYYYFESKFEILNAITERMVRENLNELKDVLDDSDRDAVDRICIFFRVSRGWKTSDINNLLDHIRILQKPENAIFRSKLREKQVDMLSPLLAGIIKRGIEQGVLDPAVPIDLARFLVRLGWDLNDMISEMLLELKNQQISMRDIEKQIAQYQTAIAKITGVPSESIHLINQKFIRELAEKFNPQNSQSKA